MGWVTKLCVTFIGFVVAANVLPPRIVVLSGIVYLAWVAGVFHGLWYVCRRLTPRQFKWPRWLGWLSRNRMHPPLLVKVEGTIGAGKTYALEYWQWAPLFGATKWSRTAEYIPDSVLKQYYENQSVTGIIYEHYMTAIRRRDEQLARAQRDTMNVSDRTLIGSFVFALANYVTNSYSREHVKELIGLKNIDWTLRREEITVDTTWPQIVVVFFATPFETCHKRVAARGGVDAALPVHYHEIVTFVYSYVMYSLATSYPDVGFVVGEDYSMLELGRIDYAQQRKRTLDCAARGLDIVLTVDEARRFDDAINMAELAKVYGFAWSKPTADGRVRGWIASKRIEAALFERQQYRRDAVAASESESAALVDREQYRRDAVASSESETLIKKTN